MPSRGGRVYFQEINFIIFFLLHLNRANLPFSTSDLTSKAIFSFFFISPSDSPGIGFYSRKTYLSQGTKKGKQKSTEKLNALIFSSNGTRGGDFAVIGV